MPKKFLFNKIFSLRIRYEETTQCDYYSPEEVVVVWTLDQVLEAFIWTKYYSIVFSILILCNAIGTAIFFQEILHNLSQKKTEKMQFYLNETKSKFNVKTLGTS